MLKNKTDKKFEELNERLDGILQVLGAIREMPDVETLKESFDMCTEEFKDIRGDLTANIYRTQSMMNQLKGIVSMSRAALDEGRKFSEFLELPRLMNAWSQDYRSLSEKVSSIDKTVFRLDELREMHVAMDHLAKENQKLRKELDERRM